jgi:AraC-like DNA-binding protein
MTARDVLKKSATVRQGQPVPLLGQAVSGFRQRGAAVPLRQYFASTWIHRAAEAAHTSAIVPDGCADLVFASGVVYIAGPTRSVRIESPRPGRTVVGLRFQPGAAASWLRTSAAELVDISRPLEDLWGSEARRLSDWLSEAATPEEIAERLEGALALRVANIDPPDDVPLAIFRHVASNTRSASSVMPRLIRDLGVAERTIRRRCMDAFGFGPKTLDRILRFQCFLDLAGRADSTDMASLAVAAGYSDQAHLSRETQWMAGVTPAVVRTQLLAGVGRKPLWRMGIYGF